MKKIFLFFLVVVCLAYDLASGKTIEITDMIGRKITVPHNPRKIICLGPGALRLIVYLDAQDKVAGVEDMEKLNPVGRPYWMANLHLTKLPRIGPGGPASINKKPDLEAILSVSPDLIFMTYADVSLANDVQNTLKIPVVVLSYGVFATFDEVIYDSLKLAGKILDREQRAQAVINFIESARKLLRNRTDNIPDSEKPTVFVGGIGFRGAFGIESSEKNYIPLKWVGAKNVTDNVKASEGSHVFIDKEKLLSLNPDVIFLDGGGLTLIKQDIMKKSSYYKALKAFQEKRVYLLFPFNSYTTNVESAIVDAYAIACILYPKQFVDIDLEKKADDIYTFMVGKPVYSEMKKNYGKIGASY